MTITPTPEQEQILVKAMEAGLIERAEDALDVGLETLLGRLTNRRRPESAEEWIARFHSFVRSHSTSTPLLSDEAISRESIYGDRGL